MINESMYQLGAQPSAIRELFAYGLERKAQIGDDKVFDFSLGNPSIPAPQAVADALVELAGQSAVELHGYTPAQGLLSCRKAIADNLNARFGTSYTPDELYMTMGAAASLACSIKALANPGDDVIVVSPYFPEYRLWIEAAGARCVEVPARTQDFQIDVDAMGSAITERTRAVIVNSPNNPVGTVYSEQNIRELASLLREAGERFGEPIYLISDEPYREICFTDTPAWIPSIYENTIVCYSWSKSLSMPGERIGYVLVPGGIADSARVYAAVCGAGRALGYVCAPAMFQMVIERCINEPTDVEAYATNRRLLTGIMDDLGYSYIEPEGAFYLWVRSLEDDAEAFAERARAHELLLVPSNGFGCEGWVRIGYCVAQSVIEGSRDAFAALMAEYRSQ